MGIELLCLYEVSVINQQVGLYGDDYTSQHPYKILKKTHAEIMALFGMELHAINI